MESSETQSHEIETNEMQSQEITSDIDHWDVSKLQKWLGLNMRIETIFQSKEWNNTDEIRQYMLLNKMDFNGLLDSWILKTDPVTKCTSAMPLNCMFLEACVIARYCYLVDMMKAKDNKRVHDYFPDCKELDLMDVAIDDMDWKQFQQSFQNIQLNWTKFALNPCSPQDDLKSLLLKMMARFGFFTAWSFKENEELNDPQACEKSASTPGEYRLCDQQIVYMASAFWNMFYSMWLQENAVLSSLPEENRDVIEERLKDIVAIHHHHLEASNDTYFTTTMHDDIMVGSLLQYMHRFSGMFHSVSQVAYFHNPGYQRRRPPDSVESLMQASRPSIEKIPTLQQLYPDLELYHEVQYWDQLPKENKRWFWLHTPGLVFLVRNRGHHCLRRNDVLRDILWNPDPYELLKIYVLSLNPTIFMNLESSASNDTEDVRC